VILSQDLKALTMSPAEAKGIAADTAKAARCHLAFPGSARIKEASSIINERSVIRRHPVGDAVSVPGKQTASPTDLQLSRKRSLNPAL
jgi:hypothetical protein